MLQKADVPLAETVLFKYLRYEITISCRNHALNIQKRLKKKKKALTLIKMFPFTPSILHFINDSSFEGNAHTPPPYTIPGLQQSVSLSEY